MKRTRTRTRLTAAFLMVFILASLFTTEAFAANNQFIDVGSGAWYRDAVQWAYDNGYIAGTSETTFSPDNPCTRAQIVTILWNVAGNPIEDCERVFSDVEDGAWYSQAVKWAVNHGITSGVSETSFAPDVVCDRSQTMTMLWRYFGSANVNENLWFQDVPKTSFYYKAVVWAVYNGVTAGTGIWTFSPTMPVNRAMFVTFLYGTKHLLEGGTHSFVKQQDIPATCTLPGGRIDVCSQCGKARTIYSVNALGHSYRKAVLVSDATTTKATKYQLQCFRCGVKENVVHTLGVPISKNPTCYQNAGVKSHTWTTSELNNGIKLTGKNGATVVIKRKWFASAWCYIADITLPANKYSAFHGTLNYSNGKLFYRRPIDQLAAMTGAKLLINGDYCFDQEGSGWGGLRGGVKFGSTVQAETSAPAKYWNPKDGSYGTVWDFANANNIPMSGGAVSLDKLKAYGITDTIRWWGDPWIKNGAFSTSVYNSGKDYDASTYTYSARRERTFMGFRRDGSTTHVILVVTDGYGYAGGTYGIGKLADSSDKASYGLTSREEMLLMSTLGCDFCMGLDGGYSTAMIIRYNGKVEALNNTYYGSGSPGRPLSDFFVFE